MSKKIKGPINGVLTASFDGKAKSSLSADEAKNTTLLVLLSIVGNEQCGGDFLRAIINNTLAGHKFTTFLLADDIYWHNLKGLTTTSDEKAVFIQQARAKCAEYLQANIKHFLDVFTRTIPGFSINCFKRSCDELNLSIFERVDEINLIAESYEIPFRIERWEPWISNAKHSFAANYTDIMAQYESALTLNDTIHKTAEDFARRHLAQPVDAADTELAKYPEASDRLQLLRRRSRDYLREEGPAIFWTAAKQGINFIAYPGTMLEPFITVRASFIVANSATPTHNVAVQVENPDTTANWLVINFKRIAQPVNTVSLGIKRPLPTLAADYGHIAGRLSPLARCAPFAGKKHLFFSPDISCNSRPEIPTTTLRRASSLGAMAQQYRHSPFLVIQELARQRDEKEDDAQYGLAHESIHVLLERLGNLPLDIQARLLQSYLCEIELAISDQKAAELVDTGPGYKM